MTETRPRSGSRAPKPDPLEDILKAEQVQVPAVKVVGDFFNGIRYVSSTAMSGLLGFANLKDSDRTVLIPYVETRNEGRCRRHGWPT